MSFVVTAPELVEAAAQDLAGVRSALGQATAAAAAPTTGILSAGADEVSAAIASVFGSHGQEFQALSAQAAAFHEEFVNLLNASAGSYLSTDLANAEQTLLSGATAAAPTTLGSFAATVAGPYKSLITNTVTNLDSLGNALASNPTPILRQFLNNQVGYVETGIANLSNVPAIVANSIQNIANFNPVALAQLLINQQIGYAQTIATALGSAAHDFTTGLYALPASFQSAFQALSTGNFSGALTDLGTGFGNLFITGFNVTAGADAVLTITPTGTLGDLLPILSVPGEMAQNFTNLLPAGSIPAQVAQHFTNVVNTLTDTTVTSTLNLFIEPDGGIGVIIDANLGVPLTLGIEALGAPLATAGALHSSVTSFVDAVATGNPLGAAAAVLDAPAVVANGFLNGQSTLPLTIDALRIPTTLNLPLDGILVPTGPYTATIPLLGGDFPVTGTPVGGIIPGLLTFVPGELAQALGAPDTL